MTAHMETWQSRLQLASLCKSPHVAVGIAILLLQFIHPALHFRIYSVIKAAIASLVVLALLFFPPCLRLDWTIGEEHGQGHRELNEKSSGASESRTPV